MTVRSLYLAPVTAVFPAPARTGQGGAAVYEQQRNRTSDADDSAARADRVVELLGARDEVELALKASLGGLPRERDETLARMAEVLQATAQGLALDAAAVWADMPERVLRNWLAKDPAFAAALRSAEALAGAHGLAAGPATTPTPAMVRVAVLALSRGATWPQAVAVAGFPVRGFRRLSQTHPVLAALVEAARRARPRKPKNFVPAGYRPRRPGQAPPGPRAFRLVRREDQVLP
ncbi:hypothetical protein [Streptomyces sp. NBC_00454]|uniref:hypothetical protein n=1 Tax=Streptomyces sp. NBC_00454 TaxID=2975747 RepID=UPI0030E114EE